MTPYRLLLLSILGLALLFGVIVSSQAQPAPTAYLTTHTPPPGLSHIDYGQTVEGDLDDLGYFEFFGESGDIIVIRLESPSFTPFLLLEDIYGAAVASDDGVPSAMIGPYVLRQTGNFRLLAGRRESVTEGRFSLRLEKVEPIPMTYGDVVQVKFTQPDDVYYFSFEAGIFDEVTVAVTSDGTIDTRLRIRESTDSEDFAADDDSGVGFNPTLRDLQMPSRNQYIVTLEPSTPDEMGTVAVSLLGKHITTLDDGPQTFTLNAVRSQVMLPFPVRAGERVRITVKVISGSAESLTILLTQAGLTLAESRGGSLNDVSLLVTIPYNGTANVIADSLAEVEVQVTLERLE